MQYPASWLQGASLGEKIACELRLQIVSGTIKPNTILSENQIADEFGTSRSPVREALKTLFTEGLIRLERMGAVVLGLTPKDIEEIYDVRFFIETFILERLSKIQHENLVTALNQIIDKMEMAAKHHDFIEFAYQDLHFHEIMILEGDHTRILHLWNNIRHIVLAALLVATEKRFTAETHEIKPLIDKHRLIVNALISKDSSNMKQVIQEHFEDTRHTVNNTVLNHKIHER
ncbi:GntR family transcriptional regulator [Neobacillus sp. NPDC093127]|uniref:GntR family transcriptional regulator n=1 Tax=Neobacillus sp. NPDC093127 TaxID=3364296 RepID=UPI0037F520D2